MINIINNLPANMVGFQATGEVTADDFQTVLIPTVEAFTEKQKELNYLLRVDTTLDNFTAGAWLQDAWLGLKTLTNWNRAAIVYDSEVVKNITEVFSKVMIGEFKVFDKKDYDKAVDWVSGKIELND